MSSESNLPEGQSPPREAALAYAGRGFSVIPIPHQSKNPGRLGWEQWRLTADTIPEHFNGHPQNIGVLLGEPSGWLIDVDLDHPRAVELAPQFLPPTPAVFGRLGKPRSHWLYKVTGPAATKKFRSKSAGMIVEFRSTGAQTVFPPSTHETGEPIRWETEGAEPALVDPEDLLAQVRSLADAVKCELGEKAAPKTKREKVDKTVTTHNPNTDAETGTGNADRTAICLAAMLRMSIVDQKDGSSRLFACACRMVEHDLKDSQAITTFRAYEAKKPFPRAWTDPEILQRVRDAERDCQRGTALERAIRPKIVIDTNEFRVVSQTVDSLGSDQDLFQRGNLLVRVQREQVSEKGISRPLGSPTIVQVPQANLRDRMTQFAAFTKIVPKGDTLREMAAHPPTWLVGAVEARGEWPGIRPLNAVSDIPVLRADGSIWQTPGYDAETGVLYQPACEFPQIHDELMLDDAQLAIDELLDVVGDFRFESNDHRSAWLAGLLTPLARYMYTGPTPLFLIDANVRGAGKGLLAQTIGWIILGREMPVSSYADDSEEMRKKVTTIALCGDPLVLLDNLEGNFGNDVLDRALTATRWKDRLLGKNQIVDVPLLTTWYGTGNNVAVAADTTRRVIHIRLDVLAERPEERTDFRHPDLIGWLKSQRGRLVAAGLTVLAAYCRSHKPQQGLTAFGSFEGWSRIVREALVWAGQPDPCLTRTRLAETADVTADALAQVLISWRQYDSEQQGLVIADVMARLYPPLREHIPTDAASIAMRSAFENLVGCPPGKTPTARQVGNKLRAFRRRVVAGTYLDTNPQEQTRGGALWRLWEANSQT